MHPSGLTKRHVALLFKLALFCVVLVAASQAGDWIVGELSLSLRPSNEEYLHWLIMTAMAVYIVLMALPFVPGVEIGAMLMMMFGAKIVPLVYTATVLALVLAYLAGRFVPYRFVIELFETLHLRRASALLTRIQPLSLEERLEFLLQGATAPWVSVLLKYRYIAIAVALNTPGNALIGGGGGISLAAGFSSLFSISAYATTVALAVAPLPLAVWLAGN